MPKHNAQFLFDTMDQDAYDLDLYQDKTIAETPSALRNAIQFQETLIDQETDQTDLDFDPKFDSMDLPAHHKKHSFHF